MYLYLYAFILAYLLCFLNAFLYLSHSFCYIYFSFFPLYFFFFSLSFFYSISFLTIIYIYIYLFIHPLSLQYESSSRPCDAVSAGGVWLQRQSHRRQLPHAQRQNTGEELRTRFKDLYKCVKEIIIIIKEKQKRRGIYISKYKYIGLRIRQRMKGGNVL